MSFPKEIYINNTILRKIEVSSTNKLEKIIHDYPYRVYCLMDEKIEKQELTLFMVVYVSSKTNYILLVDQSNQINSTMNLDGEVVENGFYEVIDVGFIERYPFSFYVTQ